MYDDENKLAEEMRPLTEDEMKTLTVLAEKGDGKAQLRLGQAFLFEKVVPDYSKAYRYFRKAVEQGYGAELDVHLSKDGRLVVIHDESLLRTAGVKRKVCECTTKELRSYFLEETGEPIPFLEEVLPLFAGKPPLVIELKPHAKNHAALAEATCKLLDQYPQLQYCIESFDPRALLWLKKNRPEIIRGQLAENFLKAKQNPLNIVLKFIMTNHLMNFLSMPDFVAYKFADRNTFGTKLCRKLWKLQGVTWTIRSQEDYDTAVKEGWIPIFENYRP